MKMLYLSLAIMAGLTGCEDPGDRPATWPYIHAAIIVPSCATASCHSDLTRRAGIVLDDRDDAYAVLAEELFVIPGDSRSPLMFLLEGDERTLMPPDAPLPEADVELVRRWIVDGADPQ